MQATLFIILKSRKLHFSLQDIIPSTSQATTPTCQDYIHFSLCPSTYLQSLPISYHLYNPDEVQESINENTEHCWGRTDPADWCLPTIKSELVGAVSWLVLQYAADVQSFTQETTVLGKPCEVLSSPDINTMTEIFRFISQAVSATDIQTAPQIILSYY